MGVDLSGFLTFALDSDLAVPSELSCVEQGSLDDCGLRASRCCRGHAIGVDDAPKFGLRLASLSDPPAVVLRERKCLV